MKNQFCLTLSETDLFGSDYDGYIDWTEYVNITYENGNIKSTTNKSAENTPYFTKSLKWYGGLPQTNGSYDDICGSSNMIFNSEGSNYFPAGISIGFFIVDKNGKFEPLFSDFWANSYANDGTCDNHTEFNHPQAMRFADSYSSSIIYGFEDVPLNYDGTAYTELSACDKDFNDVIFYISSNPSIVSADIEELTQNSSSTESCYGTLLFEDLFPDKGDYDMNDVVVTYKYTKYFHANSSSQNILDKIECEFTAIHSGATYNNDFKVMISKDKDDGTREQLIKDSQIVWTYFESHAKTCYDFANDAIVSNNSTDYTKTITFYFTSDGTADGSEGKFEKDNVSFDYINPYIYVQGTGYEVHLTKRSYSTDANVTAKMSTLDDALKKYLVGSSGKEAYSSFALDLRGYTGFEIVTEREQIWDYYPKYKQWAIDQGYSNTDWYKYPHQE